MSLVFSREKTLRQKLMALAFSQGVQAMLLFRLAALLRGNCLLRKLSLHLFLYRFNQFACGVDIDPGARIGRRFCMPHPAGIVIGGTAEIGDDVVVMQHATIGSRRLGEQGLRHGKVGDRVFIGPGAMILGAVSIGADTRIGAGSVVLADVAAGATVFGVHGGSRSC